MKVARGIELPADAVTQTYGFIGRKGSGKTYAAGKLAESLLTEGCQVVVLDPVGNWYGLRLDRDGNKASKYNVPILGGEHGDVPLEPGGGQVVADFVVSTGSSLVLDVSLFRKNQRKEFVAHFAEQLFQRKKTHRMPLMLIIEEAQVFAPQRAGRGEERMLGAIEDIVRLGRNYGIGSAMISQRPQSVNKEVLNQCEPLVVFQLVAKHERDAVRGWMQHVGSDAQALLDELPALQTGECFFWSPAWLRQFERTRFYAKSSYDASATPTLGQSRPEPGKLKPVDLKALQQSMAETIERAKADDPKALKKEIQKLKTELAHRPTEIDQGAVDRAIAERDRHWQAEIQRVANQSRGLVDRLQRIEQIAHLNGEAAAIKQPPSPPKPSAPPRQTRPIAQPRPARVVDSEELSAPQQKILQSLAWWKAGGIETPNRHQTAFVAGYTVNGHFNNMVGTLRTAGLVDYPKGNCLALTDEGLGRVEIQDVPTRDALIDSVRGVLRNEPQRRIFDALVSFDSPVSREQLAEATGYTVNGHFNNMVGTLRSLGVADYPAGGMVGLSEIFDALPA